MNEIIQRLVDRTGLSEEQADSALQTVLGFLKEKLPAPMAAQVEGLLGGETAGEAAGGLGGLAAGVGGMFGKR